MLKVFSLTHLLIILQIERKKLFIQEKITVENMAFSVTKVAQLLIRSGKPTMCRWKQTFDHLKVPTLNPEDLEEEFCRGSGPGGQAVNKTNNAVILKHKPSGLIVKCHQTRSLARNRELAREILTDKLDQMINGEMSLTAQKKRILEKKSRESSKRSEKLSELKEQWKKREGIE